MKRSPEHIKQAAIEAMNGSASPEDLAMLQDYLSSAENNPKNELFTPEEWQATPDTRLTGEVRDAMLKSILGERGIVKPFPKVLLRYAAILLLIAGTATYLYTSPSFRSNPGVSETRQAGQPVILPGTNKATLTLADGTTIALDNATRGSLAKQGATTIIKLNSGELAYKASGATVAVGNNTISTPKGGQYQITLPDGSQVWLNAMSSVTFPVAFSGKERKVHVTGEAYFDVASKSNAPFMVSAPDGTIVEVLGTQFNINAYMEQASVKTSLIAGAVKINTSILKPGQAYIAGKVIQTNVDQDIAWKNGVFNFEDLSVRDAMNQLARWYDLNIVYEGSVENKVFGGKIGRDLTMSQVLRGLDGVGMRLRLDGRTLYVRP